MNQHDLDEINNEYNEVDTARGVARQAAYEAYDEYDKRRADKDHTDVCFRRLLFCLNETCEGDIPNDERAKLAALAVEAENATTAAKSAWAVYMQKAYYWQEAEAKLNELTVRLRNLIGRYGI